MGFVFSFPFYPTSGIVDPESSGTFETALASLVSQTTSDDRGVSKWNTPVMTDAPKLYHIAHLD